MGELKTKASQMIDAIFNTGYPNPINLFAALVLTLLPLLSPLVAAMDGGPLFPSWRHGLAGLLALGYLLAWSRLRVFNPNRSTRFYWGYLIVQTIIVSLIYSLDGGLTRFLFVVVAVQAVYMNPVRRWAPFLGTLAVLWLTLYLVIAPRGTGASMVATIGMYFLYLLFAAFVTFTSVQQERQNEVAQELLEGVNLRHQQLRAYDLTVEHRTEMEERDRLARTICTTLMTRLADLSDQLERLKRGEIPLDRASARAARLQAKEVLGAIRAAVRTLRPGEDGEIEEEESGPTLAPPQPEIDMKWTEPLRLFHVWNVGVIVVTTGVMVSSLLVGKSPQWALFLGEGLALQAAYGLAAFLKQPWSRSLFVVIQAGLIVVMVANSREPLMNHLFLIIAAQAVFLMPEVNRWVVAAVIFPSALSAAALWLTGLFDHQQSLLLSLTAAFSVTNFFGAVTAFMTRRQVEARQRAILYAEQLAEVNRLLEQRLQDVRRMAIARERVRMAREIHDGLGHHLTIVIVELQQAEQLVDEDREACIQHLSSAQDVIRTAMAAGQELYQSLEKFEQPLDVAIGELVRSWQKGNDTEISLKIRGSLRNLSTAARVTIYRAVQESLTNIQKHARASTVDVTLFQQGDRVTLTVRNDDTGAAPPLVVAPGGFGLIGLRERAETLHGTFTAGPLPTGGFEVKLSLPLGV